MPISWSFAALLALAAPTDVDRVDHSDFDRILQESVREEQVDSLGIRRDHFETLEAYLDRMAEVDPAKLDRAVSLAFHLNLYNATMIREVVLRYRAGYTVAEGEYGIFDEPLVRLAGRKISLNQLENEVIRPTFQEPRIHVALVCAALSCPPLIPRAYRANDLDEVLSANELRFVTDSGRNLVERGSRKLRTSQIFHWYAEDFGGKSGVPGYFDRRHPDDLSGFSLGEPLEYDWTLNFLPPSGRWVQVSGSSARLLKEPGGDVVASADSREVFEVISEKDSWWKVRRPFGKGEAWLEKRATAAFE